MSKTRAEVKFETLSNTMPKEKVHALGDPLADTQAEVEPQTLSIRSGDRNTKRTLENVKADALFNALANRLAEVEATILNKKTGRSEGRGTSRCLN